MLTLKILRLMQERARQKHSNMRCAHQVWRQMAYAMATRDGGDMAKAMQGLCMLQHAVRTWSTWCCFDTLPSTPVTRQLTLSGLGTSSGFEAT